jgi:signal transduction histidine kinase
MSMTVLDRIAGRVGTVTNVGLGLVFAAILGADAAWTAYHGGNWAFELAVGGIVCVLALFRDRNRTWAAGTGLVVCGAAGIAAEMAHLPSQPGVPATAGLLVLGAACVRVAAARPAALVAVAGVVVMVAGRVTAPPLYVVALVFFGVTLWCGALGVGLWLRFLDTRRRMAIDAARRDERLELARELHDVVAHHITGIVVQAQAARVVGAKHPETVESTLAGIESAATDALAAMRKVVGLLRDPDDGAATSPGPEQLTALVARFAKHGPAVTLHLPTGPTEQFWPPEISTTVYRVVQESLTNIVRHASTADSVTVTVTHDTRSVTVEIADDAPPAAIRHPHSGGHGLVGMRERVEALGGALRAGPKAGAGWSVHATLPVTAEGRS